MKKPFVHSATGMTGQMRAVPSFPGYFASEEGFIYRNGVRLKCSESTGGYLQLTVWFNGKSKCTSPHRMTCEAFHGPCPPGHECRHLDGTRKNNIPSNLQWATRRENLSDRSTFTASTVKVIRLSALKWWIAGFQRIALSSAGMLSRPRAMASSRQLA